MNYRKARKLSIGDKVIPKGSLAAITVTKVEDTGRPPKNILVHTDVGRIYHHTQIH